MSGSPSFYHLTEPHDGGLILDMSRLRPLKALTARQQAFLAEFPRDLNATQAAIRAGYSPKTAKVQGCQMLKMLQDHLNRDLNFSAPGAWTSESHTRLDRFLQALWRLCEYDVRKMFDPHGNLLKPCELPAEVAPALASFEDVEKFKGKGESRTLVRRTTKVRFVDRVSALTLLCKVYNFSVDCTGTSGKSETPIAPPVAISVTDPVSTSRQITRC